MFYITLSLFLTFASCKSNEDYVEPNSQSKASNTESEMIQLDSTNKSSNPIIVLDTSIMCVQGYNETELVIRNKVEYEKLLENRSPHPDCKNYTLPPINFEKYILIGIRRSLAGLNLTFEKQVFSKNNIFSINYQITQHGREKRLNHIREYFLIEKKDSKSLVEFNYTKKYAYD